MQCKKKEVRNLFNLLEEFKCDNCPNFLQDEIIKIGYQTIKIYYLCNMCINDYKTYLFASKKAKLIFKDIIENTDKDIIFLWVSKKDDFHNYYQELEKFMEMGMKIILII